MTHLMLCNHNNTKMKLVAWATVCRGRHDQGFVYTRCCALCGAVMRK